MRGQQTCPLTIYYFNMWTVSLDVSTQRQGSKFKKSSGRLLATNWRNIVARCKFLVASLYNLNDAVHNTRASDKKHVRNTAKFARNLIKYMSMQHIWNLSRLLRLFNCQKLANLSWNFITTRSEQRPKTTRRKLCCKKLGTSYDVKSFAHFSSTFLSE